MSNKLSGVKDTLFIPLMARIEISKKYPEYFYDEKALSLENEIAQNIITQKSSEYTMIASASRAKLMDKSVIEFSENKEKVNIVCIGCGLETMAFRLKEHIDKLHFYEVDFPSVIQSRNNVLGCLENETLISGNANEIQFNKYMDCNLPTLFVVAGVFQYFRENEVLNLIKKLQENFSDSDILFDTTNELGIKYAERYVKKTGNKDARMYFFIDNPENFAKKSNTKLISCKGFYGEIDSKLRKKLNLYTKIASRFSDNKKMAMILQYKL